MHNFTFENQGSNTNLVYKIKKDDELDTTSLGMLTNNKIPGLAQTIFTQVDETKYIKYNVTARVTAKDFFDGPVDKKQLLGVFSGIIDGILCAEDYMIDINTILLDLNNIYTDVSTYDTVLICLPIIGQEQGGVDFGEFFKNIMFNIQYKETGDYVTEILNYLNSTPIFSLHDFKLIIDKFKTKGSDDKSSKPTFKTKPVEKTSVTQSQAPGFGQAQVHINSNSNVHTQNSNPSVQRPKATNPQLSNSKGSNQKSTVQKSTKEKDMSLFYLLSNYNKENSKIYKMQKAKRKAEKANRKNKANKGKNVNQQNKNTQGASFAVPGAPVHNVDYAIPGKPEQNTSNKSVGQEGNKQQNISVGQSNKQSAPVQNQQTIPQEQNLQTSNMNFGETTVLGGNTAGETTVLNNVQEDKQEVIPYLLRTKNNERINIEKVVFRIGKEKSYVDYFISDNATISRSHANIITRDDRYFVVDTNSTNHTYINGQMIQSNSEVEITHGFKIKFADEEFEFRTY